MITKTKIYLDIDGVLLANDYNAANYCHEFLEFVISKFDVYWLTTHCHGDAQTAIDRLSLVFPSETIALIQNIKPTDWVTAKTEAIDFVAPFLWFDDDLFDDERADLEQRGLLNNWIEVDLSKNEDQLLNFITSFPLPVVADSVIEIK
jgi:hypothetical protein